MPRRGETAEITPQAAADYLNSITTELSRLAAAVRLDTLAYLLDLAALEASQCAGRKPPDKPIGAGRRGEVTRP